jgi:hypothetical protein
VQEEVGLPKEFGAAGFMKSLLQSESMKLSNPAKLKFII